MKALSNDEVLQYISLHLERWKFEGGTLKKEFGFKNFMDAFSFMTTIALEAEKMDHHPAWSNVYNKVEISLSTHSAGGITQHDFDLATKIDAAFEKYKSG